MIGSPPQGRRRALIVRWTAISVLAGVASAAAAGWLTRDAARPVVAGDRDVGGLVDVQARPLPADVPPLRLVERGLEAGLARAPFRGRRTRSLPEDMGSGVAVLDADGDGDLDLLFAGSGSGGEGGPCLLYRNDGGLRFTDVSAEALPPVAVTGMAVAAADADGDGDTDALVTGHGGNLFLRNRGDGTFEDGTDGAGLRGGGFCAGATWADLDGDGLLDVYVTRYVATSADPALLARTTGQYGLQIPAALNPSSFPPQTNLCFRNRGDGTFEEVAAAWGVEDPRGRGLGAAVVDLDGDGRPEIYVANDVSDNALFRNLGGGRFEDVSYASCAADYRGAMGLAVEDVDGDGAPDLFVTHWLAQENALYRNVTAAVAPAADGVRRPLFQDVAEPLGLGSTALDFVGWGAAFSDLDGNGHLDLVVANGSTFEGEGDRSLLVPQAPLVYWNAGPGRGFFVVTARAGVAPPLSARGLAAGDLDGDGDEDFVVTVLGERPRLWVNETPRRGGFLAVRLRARGPDRSGIGARVTVTAAGVRRVRFVGASPSYLSTHAAALVFGLGAAPRADRVEVRFPSGAVVVREGVNAGPVEIVE